MIDERLEYLLKEYKLERFVWVKKGVFPVMWKDDKCSCIYMKVKDEPVFVVDRDRAEYLYKMEIMSIVIKEEGESFGEETDHIR